MSFGGYKFSGLRVDYDSNKTAIQMALLIHKARVKSFMSANALASNPWVFDPNKLSGTVAFETESNAIYELKGSSSNVCGYASFFKYTGSPVGYYMILTINSATVTTATSAQTNISFRPDQLCCSYASGNSIISPINTSCLHSISLDEFGDIPQNGFQSIDFLPSSATRLSSIGGNGEANASGWPISVDGNSTIVSSTASNVLGYAIRGADIISLTRNNVKFSSTATNNFIRVLSLNAFSEMYNLNDSNKVLLYPVLGCGASGEVGYNSSTKAAGSFTQIFGRLNNLVAMTNYSANHIKVFPDVRSAYEATGNSVIPLEGAIFAIDGEDTFENGLYTKGSTNPELLCVNTTYNQQSNTIFDSYADGLMKVAEYSISSGYQYSCLDQSESVSISVRAGNGYVNVYIGWDTSNPDIRTEAAWPAYTG